MMNKYGDNLVWFMQECAAFIAENSDENEVEIIGSNDDGVEGVCTVNIDEVLEAGVERIEALTLALTEAAEWIRTRDDFKVSASQALKPIETLLKELS